MRTPKEEYDPLKAAFDPKSPKIIIKGNTLTIKSGDKEEVYHDPNVSREELLCIALGGTKEELHKFDEETKRAVRQSELRRKMVFGNRFKADKSLLKLFPSAKVWEILRPCATKTIVRDDLAIDNQRLNKWWCGPVGWRGQYEMILLLHEIPEGFIHDPKDLPCPIDNPE